MKITSVDTYLLRHQLPRAYGVSSLYYSTRESLVVKISTDEGLVGWGETAWLGGVRGMIEEQMKPQLLGQDPRDHRLLWRTLWGANFGNGLAQGAVDIALCDLRGKALGLSIHQLFGGKVRDRVPAYASAMNYTEGLDARDQYPAEAAELVSRGFRALKMRIGGQPIREDAAAAEAVRNAVGPDIKLMADGNGAYTLSAAIAMGRELERLGFYWFEEPMHEARYVGYEVLADKLDIALAGGECLDCRVACRELLERRAVDIIQPDATLCGGIGECLFMAELARLWNTPCMPHCWGGGISATATLHVLSMLPDFTWSRAPETPMLELDTYENPFRDELIHPKPELRDGSVAVPTGPGLGIEIDERILKKYLVE